MRMSSWRVVRPWSPLRCTIGKPPPLHLSQSRADAVSEMLCPPIVRVILSQAPPWSLQQKLSPKPSVSDSAAAGWVPATADGNLEEGGGSRLSCAAGCSACSSSPKGPKDPVIRYSVLGWLCRLGFWRVYDYWVLGPLGEGIYKGSIRDLLGFNTGLGVKKEAK